MRFMKIRELGRKLEHVRWYSKTTILVELGLTKQQHY